MEAARLLKQFCIVTAHDQDRSPKLLLSFAFVCRACGGGMLWMLLWVVPQAVYYDNQSCCSTRQLAFFNFTCSHGAPGGDAKKLGGGGVE